jgi:hypothetical protein
MPRITRMTSVLFAGLLRAFVLPAQIASPQAPPPAGTPIIASADLETDAAILRKAYEALPPGLYRYSSKAGMEAKFDALPKSLSQDLPRRDAFVAFSVFAAQVKCGHTYANFSIRRVRLQPPCFKGITVSHSTFAGLIKRSS